MLILANGALFLAQMFHSIVNVDMVVHEQQVYWLSVLG